MIRLALLLFAFPTLAWAADPPAPAPFILPPSPTPIPPPPPPNTPVNLVAGHPYVVRLNTAAVVASPAGLVKLCNKPEPVTVIDADGNDTTYTGDKSVCIVSAVKTGSCELILVSTADGSELARVQLNVGGGPPPTPPTPPAPTDPLALTLQADYIVEPDAAKAANVVKLAALYRSGINLQNIKAPPTTYAELFGDMEQAALIALPQGSIQKIQGHVSADVKAALPGAGAIDWTATAKEFNRVAGILESLR